MFNVDEVNETVINSVNEYFKKAKKEIEEELTSPGYENIFDKVEANFNQGKLSLNLDFKDDIKIGDQDIIELLARGGVLTKKDGSFIEIKPSSVLIKYLSKR